MSYKKKLFLCLSVLFLFFTNLLFARNFYICVASFWNKPFAERLIDNLAKEGIPAIIDEQEKGYDTYYRVLVNISYETQEEARKKCADLQNNPAIQALDIDNFWICEGDKVKNPEKKVTKTEDPKTSENLKPQTEPAETTIVKEEIPQEPKESIVLTENKTEEIPLSEDTPYSVKIRSYKDEQQAQNDKRRLKNKDIEAYILKTYDEKELFSFDLHAGAFSTVEETQEYQKELEEKGIENTSLSDYNNEIESIEKYNEVIEEQEVVFEDVNAEIPENFSESVKQCVKQFPINKDFQIVGLSIYDLDNIRRYNPSRKPDFPWINSNTRAVSLASYHDDLYGKDITIYIASGDKGAFEKAILENIDIEISENAKFIKAIDFETAEGIIHCKLFGKDKDYILNGVNEDKSLEILLLAQDFTINQLNEFLENCYNDSSYLAYPQLRKSLFTLPRNSKEVRRDFLCFVLEKVGMDYAKERDFSEWSLGIVGHWRSKTYYHQERSLLTVSFFDLEYDYNASKIHTLFMKYRNQGFYQLPYNLNHSVMFNGIKAWYLLDTYDNENELSFATKSYIIAVDSYDTNQFELLSEQDLKDVADDLQIWE